MPATEVRFFQDRPGRAPVLEWLLELRTKDQSAYEKCQALIRRLEEDGHELRRPTADILRDGIHELRARKGRVNYRILYFFHGKNVALLAHALTKEAEVPKSAIDLAALRKRQYTAAPDTHTFTLDASP